MKYIILCIVALILCLGIAWIPAHYIGKKKKLTRLTTILLACMISLVLICVGMFGYLSVYYHADSTSNVISQQVTMEKIDGGFFFDGPGNDSALIFYPGAKVETLAYAPLMTALAENGVDCFLADMPFHMAMFGSRIADKFLNAYAYDNWSAAGHSLGGLVISGYAAEHPDKISHLFLLASYPGSKIPDSISLCSIYGTQDGCLSPDAYEKAKEYWPVNAAEYQIAGGNHAQYANYGPQKGDHEPWISPAEQQAQTVEIILKAIGK